MPAEAVYDHALPVAGRDGRAYRVRAFAEDRGRAGVRGWLEFTPAEGEGPALRTAWLTIQPTRRDVRRWAASLGPLYLRDALERARRRSAPAPPSRPVLVRVHGVRLTGPGGVEYRVHTRARFEMPNSWVAWLEFHPVRDDAPALRTGRETSQPDLAAVQYWASGLGRIYLEGALARATRGG